MRCKTCGDYFRRTEWNTGSECEACVDSMYDESAFAADIDILQNPSGKTQPVFYDDRDDDSHGF